MLSFKQATVVLFLLTGVLSQPTDQLLHDCQGKSNVLITIKGAFIHIECLKSNHDLVESDIKCGYHQFKAQQRNNSHEFTKVKELSLRLCKIPSDLTFKKILEVFEVPERMSAKIKSIKLARNKLPLNSTQLQGLESVTNFTISYDENSVNLEPLTVLPNLKKIEIKSKRLENVSNKTRFGHLRELNVEVEEDSANNKVVKDLMLMSDKFKRVVIDQKWTKLPSIVIRKSSFRQNTKLEQLKLHWMINRIEKDAFENLQNLQQLELSGCSLSAIDSDLLPLSLKNLDLSFNQLRNVIWATHLNHLEILELKANQIQTIEANTLPSSLKSLDLSSNKLKSLIGVTHLTNLESLDLDTNALEVIDTDVFPTTLKSLDLSWNEIKEFVFRKDLPNLKYFSLEGNKILSFTLNLEKLPKIEIIFLERNNMNWLHVIGSWPSSLEQVHLNHNNVQNLDAWQWIYDHQTMINHAIYPVCNCDLQNDSKKNGSKDFNEWISTKTCNLPIPEPLVVEMFQFDCRTEKLYNCVIYRDKWYDEPTVINCSNTHWPQNDDNKKSVISINDKILHLYLSGNQDIQFLPYMNELMNKKGVNIYIYAENCNIIHPFFEINSTKVRNLKRFYLANNKITEIEVPILQKLWETRAPLTLSGNPFRCDCNHQLMYDTIIEIKSIIEDFDQMSCEDGSKFVPNRQLCV